MINLGLIKKLLLFLQKCINLEKRSQIVLWKYSGSSILINQTIEGMRKFLILRIYTKI